MTFAGMQLPPYYSGPTSYQVDSGPVTALVFCPDGRTIASGGAKGTIRLWKPDGAVKTVIEYHTPTPEAAPFLPPRQNLAVSCDGRLLAFVEGDGPVRMWELTGPLARLILELDHKYGISRKHSEPSPMTAVGPITEASKRSYCEVGCLIFSPDRRLLIAGTFTDRCIKTVKFF